MDVIEVSIPEYTINKVPDDKAIGKILDDKIKNSFLGKSILIRGVASSEHPGKSVDELIEIIEQTGTDRYDTKRVGDRYENVEDKHIDLFAFQAQVTEEAVMTQQLIWGFYHSSIGVHGRPMRIDIITIYDASQMEQIPHTYEGRADLKNDGYSFRDPEHKTNTLLGIIKIT